MDELARRIGKMQLPYPAYLAVSAVLLATVAVTANMRFPRKSPGGDRAHATRR